MNAKQWLNRGYKIVSLIEMLEEEKAYSFERATSVTSPTDAEKVKSTSGNSMEEKEIIYSDYSILLDKKIASLKQIKCETEELISKLGDNVMYEILHRRYIMYEKFSDISENMYLSLRQVYRIHKKGVNEIGKLLKNVSK